jgi:NTE family protein
LKKEDELIVAVNLNGAVSTIPLAPAVEEAKVLWKWLSPLMQYAGSKEKGLLHSAEYSLRELLISSYRMTQDRLTALMLQAYPPDVLIELPRNTCSTFEFYRAKTLLELGREECYKALSVQ